jgi:predicted regulator of Ras-like GTPase activity (Roadblock/LC7/MglB family)
MKGLGYVRFQQRRFDDAERYLAQAAAHGGGSDVSSALATVRRTSGEAPLEADSWETKARRLFADLLLDDGQTALLLDGQGLVLGGVYLDADGSDVGAGVGAQLSGISEEVERAMRHLDMGAWRSIVFETQAAVVAMAPAPSDTLLIVAASRATPLGLLRRLLGQCSDRVAAWMAEKGNAGANRGAERS